MSCSLASVEPDGPLYRLGRQPDPWAWPDWSYAGSDGTFGNRYDDPETSYRVLYASSQRIGAFLETLARFRPDLEVLAELEQIEGDDEPPPAVEPAPDAPSPFVATTSTVIEADDADLRAALGLLGLALA
jgi:hypothetical protein